ncbi:methyltransferase [Amycolatopsis vancoresmycina]|uniref:O-methyltransferase n=1 Tax=Amycolatopsis vancoresmycina DSM 44592 TaxID=1292037 RepID=R1ICN7_9PSEU|nr:methyltransferase [Amycolatopsis vancoresmycina]EOD68159.1 O-methyltransferase [Amycolatopsis vancoresmycina DSM 44592]
MTGYAGLRRKIMGAVLAQAIHAVTELGVVDRLASGPATAAELAAELGADVDALTRFLRALAGEGLFTVAAGEYALTPAGELLRSDVPGSLRHLSRLMTGEAYRVWEEASLSLRTGAPAFEPVFGAPLFEWLADRPQRQAEFDRAQAGLAEVRAQPLLQRSWDGVGHVVDVGGGNGVLLGLLLAAHPELRGTVFDRPGVVPAADVPERCRRVEGDFFVAVPEGGDVYLLAQILHDWDDTRAARILRSCRAAMPAHGRLLVLEQVIPEDGGPHPGHLLDLHMLVLLGGRERTEPAWRQVLADGGFEVRSVTPGERASVIEAVPA